MANEKSIRILGLASISPVKIFPKRSFYPWPILEELLQQTTNETFITRTMNLPSLFHKKSKIKNNNHSIL